MKQNTNLGALIAAIGAMTVGGQAVSQEWQVARGDEVRGALASGDAILAEDDTFYDAYVLPVAAGVEYTISLDSDAFDPYLIVTNHVTGKTSQDDDGGSGNNSLLSFRADRNGFVVVMVNSYKEGSGAYTLTIQ